MEEVRPGNLPEQSVMDAQGTPVRRFEIPIPQMPSHEELRKSSLLWFERIGPTLIDRWPADVLALSMETKFIRIPTGMMDDIFEPSRDGPSGAVRYLAAELDEALGWERHFIRLNSRSPKDALWPFELPLTCSGKEAMSLIGSSERALDDLCFFERIPEYPAFVCARQFIHGINTRTEYRCFVKDGHLMAVSHYDYTQPIAPPADGGENLRSHIERWFTETLKPRLHLSTVVFDIHVPHEGEIVLIELNPYGLSDPCHFGSYRAVENTSVPVAFRSAEGVAAQTDGDKSREEP